MNLRNYTDALIEELDEEVSADDKARYQAREQAARPIVKDFLDNQAPVYKEFADKYAAAFDSWANTAYFLVDGSVVKLVKKVTGNEEVCYDLYYAIQDAARYAYLLGKESILREYGLDYPGYDNIPLICTVDGEKKALAPVELLAKATTLVAVVKEDNYSGRSYYNNKTYIYYNPSAPEAALKQCGVQFLTDRVERGDFGSHDRPLAENEIPAGLKALGLTAGEFSKSECDWGD